MQSFRLTFAIALVAGCPEPVDVTAVQSPLQAPPGNVMLVIMDDLGVDKLGLYGLGAAVPRTPTIDGLASQGVMFTKAYVNPQCSPTRAALMTGRRPWRTGVGEALRVRDDQLPLSEVTIPEMIAASAAGARDSSFVGKWHLGTMQGDFLDHPNDQGFDWYSGMLTGLGDRQATDGLPQDYFDWEKTTQGVAARTTTYMTTDTADDAIDRMGQMTEPWTLVVSFHAPHTPYHAPPADLVLGRPYAGTGRNTKLHNLMVEAMDQELGRILAALPTETSLETTILLMGDNGTNERVLEPSFSQGKGEVYEGGVRVPLIVSGPEVGVPGAVSDAIIEATDVFATVADLVEVDVVAQGLTLDAVSFLPQIQDPAAPGTRTIAVSERFDQVGPDQFADVRLGVRDERWRLVRVNGSEELYDLGDDQVEGADLLASPPLDAEASAAYAALAAAVPQYWVDLGY